MAYRRCSRKRTNRTRKSNKRTFSRYNTYRYRSAKAQAYQIHSLNSRINRIEYRTRPEYKTLTNQAHALIETPTTGIANHQFWHIFHTDDIEFNNLIDGTFARLINLKIWGNFYRPELANSTIPSWCRIIVFQYPKTRGDGLSMPDIFMNYTDAGVLDGDINRPFIDHITRSVRILKDKKILLSNSNVKNKPFKFNVHPKYNFAKNPNEPYASGDIDILIITKQAVSTSATAGSLDINFKLCYTDA